MRALALAAAVWVGPGCTWFGSSIDCSDPVNVVARVGDDTLTCADTQPALRLVALLGARPPRSDTATIRSDYRSRFAADPAGVRAELSRVDAALAELDAARGLPAARLRSTRVYEALHGQGPFPADSNTSAALSRVVAPWEVDDVHHLVLSEMDIEGWIRYGSLCHEAVGRGSIAVSLNDRNQIYAMVRERFRNGSESEKVALTAFGPFWPSVEDRWEEASWEVQRVWIDTAPKPDIDASALGYLEELLLLGPEPAARVLHERLGPLELGSAPL